MRPNGRMARMRQFGSVEIPQEAFIAALKMDDSRGLSVIESPS